MFDDFWGFIGNLIETAVILIFAVCLVLSIFLGLTWLIMPHGGDPDATTIKQDTVQGKVIESVDNSSISASFNIADMSVVEVTYEDAEGKEQKGYLLINKDSEVAIKDFYSGYEGIPLKGIILNEEH